MLMAFRSQRYHLSQGRTKKKKRKKKKLDKRRDPVDGAAQWREEKVKKKDETKSASVFV